MKKWWTEKAKPWLKKYWPWIVLPIGILLALAKFFRPRPVVVAPELLGAAEHKREVEEEITRRIDVADEKRDERLAEIDKEHKETIEKLTREQKGKVEELRKDPEALNSFLLGVGKEVRDDETS